MHNIETYDYAENVNKQRVEAELNNYVSHETRREGGHGLPSPIRWINQVCSSREEAEKFLRHNDKGWYDQLAVMYRETPMTKKTKKHEDLIVALNELKEKYRQMSCEVVFTNFKSEFVGCKGCGSRLSTKYLKLNQCPLCGAEMRSQTTLNNIEKLKQRIMNTEAQLREEENKNKKKNMKNSKVRWLVKIEYHT